VEFKLLLHLNFSINITTLGFSRSDAAVIKLRKLPLLLERVGVRRIKIRQKTLFDPLILTFSLRENGLSIFNLVTVKLKRENDGNNLTSEC
jgi:hypothetical protein